jgi:hypothetical protein
MLERCDPIFDPAEAARFVRDRREQLARFRSEVMEVTASTRAAIFDSQKLIAAAKAIRDEPI